MIQGSLQVGGSPDQPSVEHAAPERGLRVCTLVSGSSGNAVLINSREGTILVDAGVSAKRLEEAAALRGIHFRSLDAVVVTHDHSDHTAGLKTLSRRYRLPLYMTAGTRSSIRSLQGQDAKIHPIQPGKTFRVAGFTLYPLRTPHDGAEPILVVIERDDMRFGVLTDLGYPFQRLGKAVAAIDGAILESNFCPQMLADGPYPWGLKRRIKGEGGHISNQEAGQVLAAHATDRLRLVLLGHLSETNNTPGAALRTVMEEAGSVVDDLLLSVAPRHAPSPWYGLSPDHPGVITSDEPQPFSVPKRDLPPAAKQDNTST